MIGWILKLLPFKRKSKKVSLDDSTHTFTSTIESKIVYTKIKKREQRIQPIRMTRAKRKEYQRKLRRLVENGASSVYYRNWNF